VPSPGCKPCQTPADQPDQPIPTSTRTLPAPWKPAPTRHDSRALGLPITTPTSRNDPPGKSTDRHERSRLGGSSVAEQMGHRKQSPRLFRPDRAQQPYVADLRGRIGDAIQADSFPAPCALAHPHNSVGRGSVQRSTHRSRFHAAGTRSLKSLVLPQDEIFVRAVRQGELGKAIAGGDGHLFIRLSGSLIHAHYAN
jgi:hypothetical protein